MTIRASFAAALLALIALGAGCSARHAEVDSPDGGGTGGTSADGGGTLTLGGSLGFGPGSCGAELCPQQAGVTICCASSEVCGFVGQVSGSCVQSVSGDRAFAVVSYPDGVLCRAAPCVQGVGCPTATPALGTACAATGPCNYCLAGDLSRSYDCTAGSWSDLGASDCYSETPVQ